MVVGQRQKTGRDPARGSRTQGVYIPGAAWEEAAAAPVADVSRAATQVRVAQPSWAGMGFPSDQMRLSVERWEWCVPKGPIKCLGVDSS